METIKAGDILSGDKFYKVLKVTKKTMNLQQIGSKIDRRIDVGVNIYHWSIPNDETIGEPFRCTLDENENWQNKGISAWWIRKHKDWVEKYDEKPVCFNIWNYGDNVTRLDFDQELYESAK